MKEFQLNGLNALVIVALTYSLTSMKAPKCSEDEFDVHSIIETGDIPQLQEFLATGPNLSELIDEEATVLMLAAGAEGDNHAEMVEMILQADGATSISVVNPEGFSALHYAARSRSSEIGRVVELLLEAGAQSDLRAAGGMTPLMFVVSQNPNRHAVDQLLKAGAKIDARDSHGNTVLHWAAGFVQQPRNAEIIALLIQSGADVNVVNNDGWTPLMAAALAPGADSIYVMLETAGGIGNKANVNAALPNGWTPLLLAVASNQDEVWSQWLPQVLIPLGQQVPDVESMKMVSAMYSTWAKLGYVGRVWSLLSARADPTVVTKDGVRIETLLADRDDLESKAIRALIEVTKKDGVSE